MVVLGEGNIKLQIVGRTKVITNVSYILKLKNNLLSVEQLQERCVFILIQHEEAESIISRRGLSCKHQNLKIRCSYYLIESYQNLPYDAFPKRSLLRVTQMPQLVYPDIYIPIKSLSNSKKRHYISFIDDYRYKVWVYFLVEKSKTCIVFKNYKSLIEKETKDFICCLCTDRVGEFTSHEFKIFCKISGINRQRTVVYTPNKIEQLSVRTVQSNMVRSILSEKQVPKNFVS